MEEIRKDIKTLSERLDGHFGQFNSTFHEHEKMEMALLELSEKRLDKMDIMLKELREEYDEKHVTISRRVAYLSYALIITFLSVLYIGYIQIIQLLK